MEKNADNRGLLVLVDKSIRLDDYKLRPEKSGLELWCTFLQQNRKSKEIFLSILLRVWMHFSSTGIFKFKFFDLIFKKLCLSQIKGYSLKTSQHKNKYS